MATDPTPSEPLPPTHFVVTSSLASFFEDIEFAQSMLENGDDDDSVKASRDFAMGSANVFVDCCTRHGFDASVAVGDERGSISAIIKIKGKRSSYSGTFKAKASK